MALHIGSRVQVPPHCDAWMMGDRYGTVVRISRTVHVKLDKSGRTVRMLRATAEDRCID